MTNYSKYQQNIIKNYYENRDAIALQRVQELVTELYLSEGKKRQRHWEQIRCTWPNWGCSIRDRSSGGAGQTRTRGEPRTETHGKVSGSPG